MSEPTEEQIKELWEWCGFKFFKPYENGAIDVLDPTGSLYLSPTPLAIPLVDLNNLFKWAVPNLQEQGLITSLVAVEHSGFDCHIIRLFADEPFITIRDKDPALALFWAIYKVIKEQK